MGSEMCIRDRYCYLQEYQNFAGIILPTNIDEFLHRISSQIRASNKVFRIGTGEFTDSLALDHISGFSKNLIKFFSERKNVLFEFKTKTSNIDNLLNEKSSDNIVIAWSINPQNVVDKNEIYSASLRQRIQSAAKCQQARYPLAFHFDPIIYYSGWEKDYSRTIEMLFSEIKPEKVKWISLGTLRFKRDLKTVIENRFPQNNILDEEMILGFDGKLRYPDFIRIEIYRKMIKLLGKCGINKKKIYLCMESSEIWRKSQIIPIFTWQDS